MTNQIKKYIKLLLYGVMFGFGSPIPGVSVGTMAILLNVYDDFFLKISVSFVKQNILGTIVFLAGWGLGLLSISNLFMLLLDYHARILHFFFMGLILGCLPMVYKKAGIVRFSVWYIVAAVIAFSFMLLLFIFGGDTANSTLYDMGGLTFQIGVWLVVASIISATMMLVPGIGGSLILLVLGVYAIYMEAVSQLDILVLALLAIGLIFGILVGIFVTRKLLEKFPQIVYCAIFGFVSGSLLILFPGFTLDLTGIISIVAALVAFAGAFFMQFYFEKHNKVS